MNIQESPVFGLNAGANAPSVGADFNGRSDACSAEKSGRPAWDAHRDASLAPCRVTRFYHDQIRKSGHYEQLRRIVEPSSEEVCSPGAWDTSGECTTTILTGLQHKFRQTALILATDRCFAYCRFCFRKRFVGVHRDEVAVDHPAIGAYIRRHPEISDVLISGGDPLILSSGRLLDLVEPLLTIPHLNSIRFGTKSIVFYPLRFYDGELTSVFKRILRAGKTPVVVAHIDHMGEVSAETEGCIRRLRSIGVEWFNQAVLLNRVNDDPEILAQTFRRLHALGVRPYYLFQARPVRQGSHFQVPLDRGIQIVREVYRRLSGIEKTFRYVMSHSTGKIEILDLSDDGRLYMRYHQSADPSQVGKVFWRSYRERACWLDDLPG